MNKIFIDEEINDALDKLRRYAVARNRNVDGEVRTVTLTDDEALAIVLHIELLTALDETPE